MIIGICGGSASGKSTLASELIRLIGKEKVTHILLDNYYIDFTKRGFHPAKVNYDHPNSFDFDLFGKHLDLLSRDKAVEMPVYDFTSHSRLGQIVHVIPADHMIIDGLFLFNIEYIASFFGLKIFVDTPEVIRLERRIQRDIQQRGRTRQSVIDQFQNFVLPMHRRFVEPNKALSDVVVRGDESIEEMVNTVREKLSDILSDRV